MDSGLASRLSSHRQREHHINLKCCLRTSSPNTVLGPHSLTPKVQSLPPPSSTSFLRRFPVFHLYDRLRSAPSPTVDVNDENRPLSDPESSATADRFLTNRSVGSGRFKFGFLRPSELKASRMMYLIFKYQLDKLNHLYPTFQNCQGQFFFKGL